MRLPPITHCRPPPTPLCWGWAPRTYAQQRGPPALQNSHPQGTNGQEQRLQATRQADMGCQSLERGLHATWLCLQLLSLWASTLQREAPRSMRPPRLGFLPHRENLLTATHLRRALRLLGAVTRSSGEAQGPPAERGRKCSHNRAQPPASTGPRP